MTDPTNTTPAGDELPAAGEQRTWWMRETWHTDIPGLAYERISAHSHVEPRAGDVRDAASDANEDLVQAHARNEGVTLITTSGAAVVISPQHVVAVEVVVIDPDGNVLKDLQSGVVGIGGGVARHNPFDGKPMS